MNSTTPLASGTVTFLFTDIEGSTRLWEEEPERMKPALAAHDALARTAVETRHGKVVKSTGDGMHAVFDDACDALAATVDLQQSLADPAKPMFERLHPGHTCGRFGADRPSAEG